MRGQYHIVVQNNRIRYELNIRRNITIIQGDSATGKTTLVNLIEQAATLGEGSGIDVICKCPCRTLRGNDWQLILAGTHEHIIFIDEENIFIKSIEFARMVKESDNYFVIVTRESLPNLPYSVEEIYGIHTSGKYHDLKRTYNETYKIYSTELTDNKIKPEMVIVEDSNAGYEFFYSVFKEHGINCLTAKGKSNLIKMTSQQSQEILIIADGAAIGSEMNELSKMMGWKKSVKCYLPESFEWLILKSGQIDGKELRDILLHPEDYIKSEEYVSWERYFVALIVSCTKGTYLQYSKNKLNEVYLKGKIKQAILDVIEGVDWNNI